MRNKASLVQNNLYQWALEICFKSKSGFDAESSPYILATDFPFLVWSRFKWEKKKILVIADSGDNILTLWPLNVAEITAVDIATKACFVNELKRAALKALSFQEFRTLFAPVYENKILPQATPDEKLNLYQRVRPLLSTFAQNWLDTQIGHTHFPSPPWREVMFAHLIPHFSSERDFYRAKKALKPYPLINLPIEEALSTLEEKFDVIYLSNIPEYIKQTLKMEDRDNDILPTLKKLYSQALQRLNYQGCLMIYSFGNTRTCPEFIASEWEICQELGLVCEPITFSFSTPLISGSHFTHTLVIMRKLH
ncbi:MAG: DUF3419 family protein [Candidatus Desulfofervidaceae bacterium]|nr:DUF3419 family protein [Candidatus Desulfofervidaceae bacterium]